MGFPKIPVIDNGGNYVTNPRYQEILRLDAMLTEKHIPHSLVKILDGWQVIYPEDGSKRIMDAIEHFGSYGQNYALTAEMKFRGVKHHSLKL